MVSLVHGRDYVMTAKLGVTQRRQDRRPRRQRSSPSAGAYPAIGAILPMLTQMMSVGVYDIPKVQLQRRRRSMTNNTTIGAYRGAGRPEATQLIERVIDVAADELGMDPAEIRRRNFLQPERVPADHADRRQLRLAASTRRRSTPCWRRPATTSCAPSRRRAASAATPSSSASACRPTSRSPRRSGCTSSTAPSRSTTTARPACSSAPASHGQGHHTAFAMLASDILGIPMDKITPRQLRHGDACPAARARWARARCRPPAAPSTWRRARCSAKAKQIAAHLLEADADDIVVGDGGLQVAGVPSRGAVVGRARRRRRTTRRSCPTAWSRRRCATSSTSTDRLDVPVRRPRRRRRGRHRDRRASTLLRHVAVDDCGRILNPLLVAGQQHGGIAQGAAQALFEEVAVRRGRQPAHVEPRWTTPSRRRPSCRSFETSNTQTDSPRNPLGRQGHRRVGHDRLDPGHPQRRRRRRVATSASPTSTCRARPSGSGRRSRRPRRRRSPGG